MAKTLKIFNAETQQWEIINAPEQVIQQVKTDNEPISDKDVIVKNYNYGDEEKEVTLDDALTTISDDIAKLKRNVSWLGEHGGGGGSNGSGTGGSGSDDTPTSYRINILTPTIIDNIATVKTEGVNIQFRVDGMKKNDICTFSYVFDGLLNSEWKTISFGETITISLPDLNIISDNTSHEISITLREPSGEDGDFVSFYIYQNILQMSVDKPTLDGGSNNIVNGEFLLGMTDAIGNINFVLKNGIKGSKTTLVFLLNSKRYETVLTNDLTKETIVPFSLWNILERNNVANNDMYAITYFAETDTNKTDEKIIYVRISNPNALSVYFNGLTYKRDVDNGGEASNIPQNDKLNFNIIVYIPTSVRYKNIYYAAELVLPNGDTENLYGTDINTKNYKNNTINGVAESSINLQLPLTNYDIDDNYVIRVKVWTHNGDKSMIEEGCFSIIEADTSTYPRQYSKRYLMFGEYSADTALFIWDKNSSAKNGKWISSVKSYMPNDYAMESDKIFQTVKIEGEMIPHNANGVSSGFISKEGDLNHMRFQNSAYGTIDFYDDETDTKGIEIINLCRTCPNGFTFSITFTTDEHPTDDKVVFFWGLNSDEGELLSGIKIKLEEATWAVRDADGKLYNIKASLRQGKKNTVDFVYREHIAYIYVNGIMNAALSIDSFIDDDIYDFPKRAYFGCDYYQNKCWNFSDVSIYEFCVYTYGLNGIQCVVNSKNAHMMGNNDEELEEYQIWKKNNLLYNEESTPSKALSYLTDIDGNYEYDNSNFVNVQANATIPILMIDANGTQFKSTNFYGLQSKNESQYNCAIKYYDRSRKSSSIDFNAYISLQGTSTLEYYVKNLELIISDFCSDDDTYTKKKLFQPREDWFPENEFTLKADIVDSAHANNATIGTWINRHSNIFNDNPPMQVLRDDTYRPKDKVTTSEKPHMHKDSRIGKETNDIDFDEKVTIKHTLEGFPIMLFIRFADKTTYEFIGIYSFNLGRYSYFNMGMSFLKEFSRREIRQPNIEVNCPAIVDHYVEYSREESFGDIKLNEIYSYEFGANGDDNNMQHETWTQYDIDLLRYYGEFRFNGENPSDKNVDYHIWQNLSELFRETSRVGGDVGGFLAINYGDKYPFTVKDNTVVQNGNIKLDYTRMYNDIFYHYMNINNAVAYYITAIALGMVDSLGKNLTLRTWTDGCYSGATAGKYAAWWTCFYDMDTALGLSNEGAETISPYAYIDEFVNNEDANINSVKVKPFASSAFNAYRSKLWSIFKDDGFRYDAGGGANAPKYYEPMWSRLRMKGGAFDNHMNFVNLMDKQISSCGELMYNYDYNMKYVKGGGQNLGLLHGQRIEYVRQWMKKRFYFLDGVFEDTTMNDRSAEFEDSPMWRSALNITKIGHQPNAPLGYDVYKVKSSNSIFLRINTGNVTVSGDENKYFVPANVETEIRASEVLSTKQTKITTTSQLTMLKGLSDLRVVNLNTNNSNDNPILNSLVEFDISGVRELQQNDGAGGPLLCPVLFSYDGKSALETINVSNTRFGDDGLTYAIDLKGFAKVKHINISNSDVNTIVFPDSMLETLDVRNSKIQTLNISSQPLLEEINADGCNKLTTISIKGCDAVSALTFGERTELPILNSVTIENCVSLKRIVITNSTSLRTITITNNPLLEDISITNCTNAALTIVITGSPLKNITLSNLENMTKVITLPERDMLTGVTSLDLRNNYVFTGYQFGDKNDYPCYGDDYIIDLTPFKNILGKDVRISNVDTLKYFRVANIEDTPFYLSPSMFVNCDNLVKIFGHIGIDTDGLFSDYKEFYLNELPAKVNKKIPFTAGSFVTTEENEYYTNITFDKSVKTYASCFANTSVNLGDAYYVMNKLRGCKVTNISGLFNGCKNIVTDKSIHEEDNILNPDFFKYVPNATNIDNILNGTNVKGLLSDELLLPIIENLTTFRNVFPANNCYIIVKEGETLKFFGETNNIKELVNFNPLPAGDCDDYAYAEEMKYSDRYYDWALLQCLPNLEKIEKSFNDCSIQFTGNEPDIEISEMFDCNPKLRSVISCFTGIDPLSNNRTNIPTISEHHSLFRGCPLLETFANSFNCESGDEDEEDDTTQRTCRVFITNDLLSSCKENIRNFGATDTGSGTCFGGFKKTVKDGIFPYEVLYGCSNITNVSGFLNGLSSDTVLTDVKIPGTMFKDCVNVTDLSNFFANMENIYYTLTPRGFENLSLINISGIFNDGSSNGGKYGMIPYELFYNKNKTITNASVALCGYSKNDNYQCEPFKVDEALIEEKLIEIIDGEPYWNIYIYDGSTDFYSKLINTEVYATYYPQGVSKAKNPHYFEPNDIWYEFLDENGETVITHKFSDIRKEKRHDDVLGIDREVLVEYTSGHTTEEYSLPIEFTDGYKEQQDTTIFGGTSEKYVGYKLSQNDLKRLVTTNYMVPSDLLKYFKNERTLNIDGILSDTSCIEASENNTDKDAKIYGLIGRIPSLLFQPINQINYLNNIFSNCALILPEKWGTARFAYVDDENIEHVQIEKVEGITYPDKLFNNLTNLSAVVGFFATTNIWGYTFIPNNLFGDNGENLSDVSSLWANTKWNYDINDEDSKLQLTNVFGGCKNLDNISQLFTNCNVYIESNFLNSTTHKTITNCEGFLLGSYDAHGSVPALWDFPNIRKYTAAYYGISEDNINNFRNIPDRYRRDASGNI